MARITRLPNGKVFREKMKLPTNYVDFETKKVTIEDVGKMVDFADKVATSTGVGAAFAAGEKIYDELISGDPKEAVKETAKVSDKVEFDPLATTIPEDARMTQRMGTMTSDTGFGERTPEQVRAAVTGRRQPAMPRTPAPAPAPAPEPTEPVQREIQRESMRRLREDLGSRGTQPILSPVIEKEEERVIPAIPAGGPATPTVPAPAPALVAPPISPTPPTEPTVPATPRTGEPIPLKREKIREVVEQALGNLGAEIARDQQSAAQRIDTTAAYAFQRPDAAEQAISIERALGIIKDFSPKNPPAPPIDIPEVVSVEELIGYARNASTPEQQQEVLRAFSDNRVTGMYAPTLASRLVGDYRKPFLRTIIASFPRQQTKTGKDSAIDRFYKFGLGMEALNRAQIRGQEAQTGLGRETTASKRAGTMKTVAAAGRTAEQAATERELREPRRLKILTETLKPYAKEFRRQLSLRRRRGGKGKKPEKLADINAAWKSTVPRIDKDISANEKQAETIQKRLDGLSDKQRGLQAIVDSYEPPRKKPIPGSPEAKALIVEQQKVRRARAELKRLQEPIEKLRKAKSELDEKRDVLLDTRRKVDDFFGAKYGSRLKTLKRKDIDPETAAVLTSVGVIGPMTPSSPDRPAAQ